MVIFFLNDVTPPYLAERTNTLNLLYQYMAERNKMTILESLRKKALNVKLEDKEAISYLVQEYDLALENALLKLKNRAVQISDLKNQLKELRYYKEMVEEKDRVIDELTKIK